MGIASSTQDSSSSHTHWSNRYEKDLPEVVYGSIDGIVTTFAVVAGSAGAELSINIILILGLANLIADGLSMSIGSYLSKRAENDSYKKHLLQQKKAIEKHPERERKELTLIFRKKGFEGDQLKQVVNQIASDPQIWVETLMKDKLEMIREVHPPFRAGLATFISFQIAGSIPLVVYIMAYSMQAGFDPFWLSAGFTTLAFVFIGYLKTYVTESRPFRSIAETLLLGLVAASAAYVLGDVLEKLLMA